MAFPIDLPEDPDLPPQEPRARTADIAVAVALGGAVGGGLRGWLESLWPASDGGFPWATFGINISGCLLLSALLVYLIEVLPPYRYARPLLGTGVLGGFTTFSTFGAETHALLGAGATGTAFAYAAGSLVFGLLASWVGLNGARSAARWVR